MNDDNYQHPLNHLRGDGDAYPDPFAALRGGGSGNKGGPNLFASLDDDDTYQDPFAALRVGDKLDGSEEYSGFARDASAAGAFASYGARPRWLAQAGGLTSDVGNGQGADVVPVQAYEPTPDDQAFLEALTAAMGRPDAPAGPRIVLDDFGNPVSGLPWPGQAEAARTGPPPAAEADTVYSRSPSGILTLDGKNYFLVKRDEDGLGTYERRGGSSVASTSASTISRPNAQHAPQERQAPNRTSNRPEVGRLVHASSTGLGALSETYETSGRGPGAVSAGIGDHGGVSYGSYQMPSKGDSLQQFLRNEGASWADRFDGMNPKVAGGDFEHTWKLVAEESPAAFFDAQHAFVERTHYNALVANIRRDTGLDINARPHAVKEVVWSTAVQHGPGNAMIHNAYRTIPKPDHASPPFNEQLIRAIYDERGRTNSSGGLVHFQKSSLAVQAGVAKRFKQERNDALRMLAGEGP